MTTYVTETFYYEQVTADGEVIHADPGAKHWMLSGNSWFGEPPKHWNQSLAKEHLYIRRYAQEKDVS